MPTDNHVEDMKKNIEIIEDAFDVFRLMKSDSKTEKIKKVYDDSLYGCPKIME